MAAGKGEVIRVDDSRHIGVVMGTGASEDELDESDEREIEEEGEEKGEEEGETGRGGKDDSEGEWEGKAEVS